MANSEAAQCHGKVKYRSYSIAHTDLMSDGAEKLRKDGARIYRCHYCQKYHIGRQNNRSNAIKLWKMEKDKALLELEPAVIYE